MNLFKTCCYALIGIALAILAFLLRPQPADACACCYRSQGSWYEYTKTLNSSELDQLNKLKFAPVAYSTRSDDADGHITESYTFSQSINERSWNLRLTSSKGESGNFSFRLPTQGIDFGADLFDQPNPDTRLYKELRLKGKVVGDGIFASGMTDDTQFQFILRGRGGNCFGDFQHWNLEISGAKADYADHSFYGHFEGSNPS